MTEKEIQKLQEENDRLRTKIEYLLALLDPHEREWALASLDETKGGTPMEKIRVWGVYSPFGYTIYSTDGRVLDRAGNSRSDSTVVLPPEHHDALSLAEIGERCEEACQQFTEELKAEWGGCHLDDSYYDNFDDDKQGG